MEYLELFVSGSALAMMIYIGHCFYCNLMGNYDIDDDCFNNETDCVSVFSQEVSR